MSQASGAGTFRPVRVLDVDVAQALPDLEPGHTPDGIPFGRARVLARIHTLPLGFVEVELDRKGMTGSALAARVRASLGAAIDRHLEADAAAQPEPGDGGVPACLRRRAHWQANGPLVSVVVPTVDRPDALADCLEDLLAQDYPRAELIVVDNAPGSSGAQDVVSRLGQSGAVRYVEESRRGSSSARNRGLAAASSPLTAFVDSDVRVDRSWLSAIVAAISGDPRVAAAPGESAASTDASSGWRPSADAAAGSILARDLETEAQTWLEEWGGYTKGFEPRVMSLRHHPTEGALFPFAPSSYGSGANMAFVTEALRAVGGFDETLGAGTPARGGEDISAFIDVVLHGGSVAYEPAAIVWHEHPRSVPELRGKLRGYGTGLTALLTRQAVRHPQEGLAIAARVPAAARYFFSPRSKRNAQHSSRFPTALLREELVGMALGPLAYARSARSRRRRRQPA